MHSVDKEIEALRAHMQPRWSEERASRIYSGIGQLRRRRAVARAGAAMGVAAAAVLCLAVLRMGEQAPVPGQAGAPALAATMPGANEHAQHRLRLADGSLAELFGPSSDLELLENRAGQVSLGLRAGRANFEVVRNPEREFSVRAGAVRVVVVGTRFEVERRADGQVRVAVQRGLVRVESPEGVRMLEAGQARLFASEPERRGRDAGPAAAPQASVENETDGALAPAVVAPEPAPARKRRPVRAAKPSWRGLIQEGDYTGAYAALRAGSPVEDAPDALMDAADAARLSGHPARAVRYLEQVVAGHRRSPVAPLAAFTLGRVLLDRLGQPHGAAEAFARARALSPSGSLAQDALAREVEALSKAGFAGRAHGLAQSYVRSYPAGRRLQAVRRYGGLAD